MTIAVEHRRDRDLQWCFEQVRDPLAARPVVAVGEPAPDVAEEVPCQRADPLPAPTASRAAARRATGQVGRDRERDRRAPSPTTSGVRKSRWKPSRMKTPSPPWPIDRGDGDEPDRRDRRDAEPGHDRGHRERQLDREEPSRRSSPCRRAASSTSAGTPSRPVTMFRTRMSSVYSVERDERRPRSTSPCTGSATRTARSTGSCRARRSPRAPARTARR